MEIQVLPLTKKDIPQAVECIQTVFADDPFFLYMFDQTTYNKPRNKASLTAHLLHALALDAPIHTAQTPDGLIVGVSWWHPPHPSPTPFSFPFSLSLLRIQTRTHLQDSLLSLRQLLANIRFAGRGGLRLTRYRQWKKLQARAHRRLWTDSRGYYFLNVLAVRDGMRGRGVGRGLVEAVTRRADEEGRSCYLESSKGMPNLLIYERLGFVRVGEIECVDGDGKEEDSMCTLYCMVREPRKVDTRS